MAGYLYALPVGLWPRDIDAFEITSYWPVDKNEYRLHVKLGSSTREEVVDRLHNRYCTPLGRPQLWWAEPSADAAKDERSELFAFFKERRVWRDREIFWFDGKEEFESMISKFTVRFRFDTEDEADDKPPPLPSIDRRISAEEQRRTNVATKKQERIDQQQLEKQQKIAQMNESFNDLIAEHFQKSETGIVRERDINELLRKYNIKFKSVRDKMSEKGFILTRKNMGKEDRSCPVYKGLEAVVVCE